MKKVFIISVIGIFLTMALSPVHAYEVTQGPTEVIYYDASKADNGYTLFKTGGGMSGTHATGWLIDMQGNVVHTWPDTVGMPTLFPDGHLFDYVSGRAGDPEGNWIKEWDWNGKLVRMLKNPADRLDLDQYHHDYQKIYNKKLKKYTMMALTWFKRTAAQNAADGAKSPRATTPSGLVEMDMDGNIVWEWNMADHYIQDYDSTKNKYVGTGKKISDYPGKFDFNNFSDNCNGMDYNEELDLVLLSGKGISEILVIDHGGTFIPGDPKGSKALAASTAGDIIYRWGNPTVSGAGDSGYIQLFGIHNAQWIRNYAWPRPHPEAGDKWIDPAAYDDTPIADYKLPGAGNFLVFDNGVDREGNGGYSTAVEINPYISGIDKATGKPIVGKVYVPQMKAGHGTGNLSNQVVWKWNVRQYGAWSFNGFYSSHISGAQRLPNGNTLICSGESGHFIEVTSNGEIVWEYVNPDTGSKGIHKWMKLGMGNEVYRAYRYSPNFPGFADKQLIPKGKITTIQTLTSFDFDRGMATGSTGGSGAAGGAGVGY